MTTYDNEIKQKLSNKYCCKTCDYYTSRKNNYETHIQSNKHKNNEMTTNDNENKQQISMSQL